MNSDEQEIPIPPKPEAIKSGPSPEFYLQFYAKLLRGVCYVKHFDIQFLPIGLRELTSTVPNPEGWQLRIFELLADTTFKGLRPTAAKEQSYCYCMGFLGGVCVNGLVTFAWSDITKDDEIVIDELAKPFIQSAPQISEEESEKILDRFWNALLKKFFNTPYNTIENLAEIFRGLHDGILAIPIRGEHLLFDSLSSRVYAVLLVFEDKIVAMNNVEEMYAFVEKILKPEVNNLTPEHFQKICQRIGLQGKVYRSMDKPIQPVQ